MNKFLKRVVLFVSVPFLLFLAVYTVLNAMVDSADNYRLPDNKTVLLLGNSHSQCSVNDTLIPPLVNMSQRGEAFFYAYPKLLKLLDSNPQIQKVIVQVSNWNIDVVMDECIYKEKYLFFSYIKYSNLLAVDQQLYLFRKNPSVFCEVQPAALKNKVKYILKGEHNYPAFNDWGRFEPRKASKADSLVHAPPQGAVRGPSVVDITYLSKIVAACKERNIKVYFLRSPIHPAFYMLKNEKEFQHILSTQYPEIPFFDYKDFPLSTDEFNDLEHLNYKGAEKFTPVVDSLVKTIM